MADIIQSMWVGPCLSAMEQLCIKSYLHHGHPFHLYTYQETEGVPEGTTIMDGNEIVPSDKIFTYEGGGFGHKSYAGFADVFRYRLLLLKGNWWVDTDSICLRPFDFTSDFVFSSEDPLPGQPILSQPNCGNLKAPVGSDLYKFLVAESENVNVRMVWGTIGPALMKRAVAKFGLQQYVQHPRTFCPVRYDYQCKSMIKAGHRFAFDQSNYAVHLWNEAWRAQKLDKDGQYESGSLYEQLKERYGVKSEGPVMYQIKPTPPPSPPPRPPSIAEQQFQQREAQAKRAVMQGTGHPFPCGCGACLAFIKR